MKSNFLIGFLFLLFFYACKNKGDRSDTTTTSENDVDAARNFIRLALDGNYDKAENLILNDSANVQYLGLLKRMYQERMDRETRINYQKASITIFSVSQLNDSTSVVRYSNSFKKITDSVKVVRHNGSWLIDLKYSFPAAEPSLP